MQASVQCAGLAGVYVASLYLWAGSREDPGVIKRRTLSVVGSTVIALVVAGMDFCGNLSQQVHAGLWGSFFTFSIYFSTVLGLGWKQCLERFKLNSWASVRNLIVGPVSEEIVFRQCFRRIFESHDVSTPWLVVLSTLLFWVAHAHHFHQIYDKTGNRLSACILIASQSAYTGMFACIAFALYFRSGSITAPIACHVICNAFHIPELGSHPIVTLASLCLTLVVFILGIYQKLEILFAEWSHLRCG